MKPRNLPIIQSMWIGDDLSNLEKLCIQSFIDHGHEFHLYTYAELGGIPHRAVVKDGNEILSADKIFRDQVGSLTGFSDWFRLELLHKRGGCWVDMDIICIKPFDFEQDIIMPHDTNNVLIFPPAHPFIEALAKSCVDCRREGAKFGAVGGIMVFPAFIDQFAMHRFIKPSQYFNPIGFDEMADIFTDTFAAADPFSPVTHALHLSNEILRRFGIDKNAVFGPKSLLENLKAKHGIVNHPNAKVIGGDQFRALETAWRKKEFETSRQTSRQKRRRRLRRERILVLLVGLIVGVVIGLFL